jgi:Zn-dependent peptidase ImmA (M78 family)
MGQTRKVFQLRLKGGSNMKSVKQIAKECNISQDVVHRFIKKLGIVKQNNESKKVLTRYQEDYLHDILYISGFITEITLESKINL